jgi:dynein light chain LC8-type
MAAYIKKEMEKESSGVWHCFVGRKFSSYVTHEAGHFIYFYVGQMGICLFKTV